MTGRRHENDCGTKAHAPQTTDRYPWLRRAAEPIQAVIERLSAPFPIEEVKVRPGAVRRDGTATLCLAYSDW